MQQGQTDGSTANERRPPAVRQPQPEKHQRTVRRTQVPITIAKLGATSKYRRKAVFAMERSLNIPAVPTHPDGAAAFDGRSLT